jgi:DNA-binding Lrp family transcriptional regulator
MVKMAQIGPYSAIPWLMDSIDRRIIAELQRDGRLSNVDLAERVGLTPAPCLRRVKRLEGDGIILGYTARIDPQAIGRGFEVLVNVDLARKDRATFEAFEAAIAALEEVVEVRRMFGLPDYVLRVATASLESYETFVSTQLGDVPGLDKLDSHLTMKLVKSPEPAGSASPRTGSTGHRR